jgi:hypothetical protein
MVIEELHRIAIRRWNSWVDEALDIVGETHQDDFTELAVPLTRSKASSTSYTR